ncbi:MAG: hypothetical protein OEV91_01790 [Desulfobulbaceae bacterium]|nr:hypothetical protein [Desulfobulbaceae bacterium]
MSFSCKNYQFDTDQCKKLHSDCVPGRPGCVLEGRVALSEELEARIEKLEKERNERVRGSA